MLESDAAVPVPVDDPMMPFALGRRVLVDSTGLTFRGDIDFVEWVTVGRKVIRAYNASAWWIGDWLVYGEWRYGQKYSTVTEALNLNYDRLRDYCYVSGNVSRIVRRSDLSWTHHRVVAKLESKQQSAWLERAAKRKWSKRELADAVAGAATPRLHVAVPALLRLSVEADQVERWRLASERAGLDFERWVAATLDAAATAMPIDVSESDGRSFGTAAIA